MGMKTELAKAIEDKLGKDSEVYKMVVTNVSHTWKRLWRRWKGWRRQ